MGFGSELAYLHGYKNLGYYTPTEQELEDYYHGAVMYFTLGGQLPLGMSKAFNLGFTMAKTGEIKQDDLQAGIHDCGGSAVSW